MGRPGLTKHRKFTRLSRLVGGPIMARGSLELMWDAAYESGDDLVGDAGDLEHLINWTGEPGALAQALVEAGFLDQTPEGMRVHDLMDHAPDYVQKRKSREQARRGKTVSDVRRDASAARWNANGCKRMQTSAVWNANGCTPSPSPSPSPVEKKHLSPAATQVDPTGVVSDEDPHAISQEASPRVCAPVPAREDEVAPSPTSEQASLPSMPLPAGAKEMREIWNEVAPAACPRWVRNSDSRSKSARARMDEHASEPGGAVAWWRRVVEKVRDSKFLRGDGGQWRADIDWMLKPANLIKVEEGKYDDRHVVGNVRTGSVRAEDMKHSEQVGVVNMDDWTGGKANG